MNKKIEDRYIIIIAALIQFTATFVNNMVSVILPDISMELGLNIDMLNWMSLAFLIIIISLSVPLGKVIAQQGVKKFTIINIMLLIAGLMLSIISYEPFMLILSRIIQGMGISALLISIYLIVVNQISEDRLGVALGIVGASGYIGMTAAPTIAGLISLVSWRYVFFFSIPICILILLMFLKVDKEWIGESHPIDKLGALIYIVAMVLFIVGLNDVDETGIFMFVLSIVLFVVLLKIEKKKEYPLINLKLLKNFKLMVADFAAFVSYFTTFISTYLVNFYLQIYLNFEPYMAGFILFTTPIVMVFVSPFSGRWADKYDSRMLSAIAMSILFCVMIMLYHVDQLPFYMLIIILVLQGVGHAMFSPPNNRFALTTVGDEDVSDATSILTTSKELGKTCSIAIFTVVFTLIMGNQVTIMDEIVDLVKTINLMMIISTVLILITIVLLLYSKYRYDEGYNLNALNFIKSIERFIRNIRRVF